MDFPIIIGDGDLKVCPSKFVKNVNYVFLCFLMFSDDEFYVRLKEANLKVIYQTFSHQSEK